MRIDLSRFDPAERLKERYNLSGWKAELVDLVFGFLIAALIYYVILPAILGANPPATIVESCSMAGVFQVGDVVILKGTSFDDIHAPVVRLNTTSVNFSIHPNDWRNKEVRQIIFYGGDPRVLNITENGDVVVYHSPLNGRQIIHRVIAKVITSDGREFLITKGDANNIPDQAKIDCAQWVMDGQVYRCIQLAPNIKDTCQYPRDVNWPGCISSPVPMNKVVGKVIFDIPLVGQIKLILMDIITLGHAYPDGILCNAPLFNIKT